MKKINDNYNNDINNINLNNTITENDELRNAIIKILHYDDNDQQHNLEDILKIDCSISLEKYSSDGKKEKKKSNNENIGKSKSLNLQLLRISLDNIYKTFFDAKTFLLNKCNFKKIDFDSRADYFLENIFYSSKKDEGVNDLPYGWVGIGLNVFCSYEKDGNWILNKNKTDEWVDLLFVPTTSLQRVIFRLMHLHT